MAWIESHQTLEKNGKLLQFANSLSINRYQAIGHLHALWWWALDNAEDGNLKRFSNAVVTRACGWTEYINDEIEVSRINEVTNADKLDNFVDALIDAGFLDRKDGGLFIHGWEKYTHRYFASVSKSNDIRSKTRERVRRFRDKESEQKEGQLEGGIGNASVTLVKRHVTPPTIPNLTIPKLLQKDIPLTRESFKKPSLETIAAYCKERGSPIDPERFYSHYESNGWKVGKNPMKSWHAAIVSWEKNSNGQLRSAPSEVVG